MGGSSKKVPAPPPIIEAPKVEDVSEEKLTEDRLRRQRAQGTTGNIISSLGSSIEDQNAATKISKLLG